MRFPDIVAEFPASSISVLGATHPNELRTRATATARLEALVKKNNSRTMHLPQPLCELKELTEFIGRRIFTLPLILGEAQITSEH